jgi:prophage antirepressor-like protein
LRRFVKWAEALDNNVFDKREAAEAPFSWNSVSNLPTPVSQNLNPFAFKGNEVRLVMRDGKPWFVLADVCRALDLENTSQTANKLDEDEQGVTNKEEFLTLTQNDSQKSGRGGARSFILVTEPGLYRVVARSDKPQAKDFMRWVNHDVLPAIRQTGGYGVPAPRSSNELVLEAMKHLIGEVDKERAEKERYKAISDQQTTVIEGKMAVIEEKNAVIKETTLMIEDMAPKVAVHDRIDRNGALQRTPLECHISRLSGRGLYLVSAAVDDRQDRRYPH